MRFGSRRNVAVGVLALMVVATVLTGCRPAKVGAKCTGTELGRDGTHVLTCTKGRWTRAISFYDVGVLIKEQTRRPLSGVKKIAAGASFNCALIDNGTVKCWGSNWDGELGTGWGDQYRRNPQTVPGLDGVTDIDAFVGHVCAIVSGGAVKCWGDNDSGQLGNGSTDSSPVPVDVVGISGATSIAVGWRHSCAVVAGGAVTCWGSNRSGQLGDGSEDDRHTPVAVDGLRGAVSLASGDDHTCGLFDDGSVACWGRNDEGQLGDGSGYSRPWPAYVEGLDGESGVAIRSIGAGAHTTCAAVTDGSVRCWGSSGSGQLGTGSEDDAYEPVVVPSIAGATQVAGSWIGHSCALTGGGTATCWGEPFARRIVPMVGGSSTPVGVAGLSGATQIDAGGGHVCARMVDSTLMCWGNNAVGQVDATPMPPYRLPLSAMAAPTRVTELP